MNLWSHLVEALAKAISGTAGLLGTNPGVGIVVLTLVGRLALIPILLPLARRSRAWRDVQRGLRPQIRELNARFKSDPAALQRELKALHAQHGIRQIDGPGLLTALIQVPLLIAFFQAVLRLSSGTRLASGGLIPGLGAGVLSLLGSKLADASTPRPLLYLAAVLPVAMAVWLGSGTGLYLVAFYAGTLVQSLLQRRPVAMAAAPVE
jgi:YidC/Oxa1 family membrane protein insertase